MDRRAFISQAGRGVVGLALAPAVGVAQKSTQPDARQLLAQLEREIPGLLKESRVPGLSIAVIRDGRLLWRRGFGVTRAGSNRRVGNDTVFNVGSISKTVFAYAVMKLHERHVLDLDTPLTRYTPLRILDGDSRLDLITARHVLSHSSGLPNWRSERDGLQIHFTPGEQYRYSGEGYHYLQSVVTQLVGQVDPRRCSLYEAGLRVCASDFDAYMRLNLLVPFGMSSSGYTASRAYERRAADPHDAQGGVLSRGRPTDVDAARYGAAGLLHTTSTDYARFLIEIMTPKRSDGFRLTGGTIAEMVRPQIKGGDSPDSWRALGWEVVRMGQEQIILHGGSNQGYHAFTAASLKRRNGYVFMMNGDGGHRLLKRMIVGDTPLNQLLTI